MAQDIVKSTAELFGNEQEVVKSTEELFGSLAKPVAPKSKWEQAKELLAGMEAAGTMPRVGMWGSTGAKPITETVSEAGGLGPYLGQLVSPEGLAKTGRSAVEGLRGLAQMPIQMGKTVGEAMATLAGKQPPPPMPGIEGGAPPQSPLEPLKQLAGLATFPIEIMKAVAADPVRAIQERPVDIALLLATPIVGKFVKQWKAGYLSKEGFSRALFETIDELNRGKADYNATYSPVHVGSNIEAPPTGFQMTPEGVGIPARPVKLPPIQEGLDAQAAGIAKTTEQGPILSRDWPTTEPAVPIPPPPTQLLPNAKYEVTPGGQVFRPGHSEKTRLVTMFREAESPIQYKEAGLRPQNTDDIRPLAGAAHASEGGWSPESIARAKTTKFFILDKGTGKIRPLVGVDAVDIRPKPGEVKLQSTVGKPGYELVEVGESAPLGLGLQKTGPESMAPAQRAAYDKYMAARDKQGVQYYKPGAKATTPPAIEPTTGAKIIRSATDAPDYGRAYVVAPRAGEQLIPEKTNAQGRVTLWKHEADAVRNIKDRHIGVKETSIYWMEREPILRDGLWHPQKAAEATRGKMMKEAVVDTVSWKKTAPNQERIGAYLISQQKGGPETLKLMGMESAPTLTPQEMSVVTAMRAKYDAWLSRINEARAVYGNDPITGVDSYAPMLRDPKMLAELGIDIVKEPNVDMLKAHLSAPPLKYLQKRVGSILPAELRAYDIYRNYAVQTSKYVTEAPVISKARAISGVLKESGNAEAVRGKLTLWADHLSGQVAPDFIHSPLYRRTVNMLNRNISRAALDLNIRSASIQPTSLVGSYTYLGNKYMVEGLWDNVHPGKRAFAKTHSNVLSTRNFDVNVTDITTPITRGGKIRRGVSKAVAKVSDIAITPLKLGDYESAQATWLGAQRRGVAPTKKGGFGMTPEESYRYADEIVVKTQGSGHPSDIAEIQRSTTGKILTVFQTFTINNWNMLKDIFGGGLARPTKTRVGQIARLLMAVEATNFIFEDALGVRSPFPAPEHAVIRGIKEHKGAGEIALEAAKELTEVYPPFGGTIRYADRWRSPLPAVFQVSWDSYLRAQEILKKAKVNERDFENLGKLLGVPGASQGRKIWAAVKNGKSLKEAIFGAKEPSKKKSGSSWSKGW